MAVTEEILPMALPHRFRNFEELSESQKDERFHNYHYVNLKAKNLRPLLREKFNPVLKSCGFSRTSDTLFSRKVEPHYVHCLRLSFSSKSPGRFIVKAGVALDILPLSDWSAFEMTRLSLDSDCLFTTNVLLSNGNPEFDNGTDLVEANETINYLISSFKDFDLNYFSQFDHFPKPIDRLEVEFVQRISALVSKNSISEYGRFGATIQFLTLRLALIHKFLGNTKSSRKLLEFGLSNHELFSLKSRYKDLLQSL